MYLCYDFAMEDLKDTLYNLETELVTQAVRSSADKLNQLLADDLVEYGSSGGIYDKKITIDSLTNEPSPSYTMYDFEVVSLSDNLAQTRFKTDRTKPDGTQLTSLRNSLWRKQDGKWQMFFHQGTPVPKVE